jgi:hypothetical protein
MSSSTLSFSVGVAVAVVVALQASRDENVLPLHLVMCSGWINRRPRDHSATSQRTPVRLTCSPSASRRACCREGPFQCAVKASWLA